MHRKYVWVWACGLCLSVACGGADEGSGEPAGWEAEEATVGAEERDDGVQIEGLMGTLSPEDVQRALEPRMPRFAACFGNRHDDFELVGGHFEMSFLIGHDGSVTEVYPRRSTIGDRDTERCLLEVAAAARFREPRGGSEAEFNWSLDFDPPDDVRPPFNWDAERTTEAVEEHGPEVLTQCRPPGQNGRYLVTAYVAPGGEVIAAGVASDQPGVAQTLDCVTEQVRTWAMPDPGSYPAKVTFVLQ